MVVEGNNITWRTNNGGSGIKVCEEHCPGEHGHSRPRLLLWAQHFHGGYQDYNYSFQRHVSVGVALPELRVLLNDLPGNDFNRVFIALPEFYAKLRKESGIGSEGCFVSAGAGSFYSRLFPAKSLHFVHSSSCLHWLSQVII